MLTANGSLQTLVFLEIFMIFNFVIKKALDFRSEYHYWTLMGKYLKFCIAVAT